MNAAAKILIVDDERHVRSALARLLRHSPFEVDTAENAATALERLSESDYDLVISDLKMPGQDGIELLSQVRDQYPDTSRILLSGHADREDLNQAINRSNIETFLDKPWDNDDLVRRIVEATRKCQARRRESADTNLRNSELQSARAMLMDLVPADLIDPDLHARSLFETCHHLGGDGLNFWRDGRNLHFYLLDVAGHGARAGMESFAVQHMLNGGDMSNPAGVVAELHQAYPYRDDVMHYLTIMAGCLDVDSGDLTYCQAGHPSPLVVSRDTFTVTRHGDGGFPVGLLDTVEFENQRLVLAPGELLVLHSDGLAEHCDDAFEAFLLMNSCLPADALTDAIIAWRNQQETDDDISALFISLTD